MPDAERPAVEASLSAGVAGRLRVATLHAAPVRIGPRAGELDREMRSHAAELRERYVDCSPGQIDELRPGRELYRSFGIDPTKTRPSSEALLRRVLRDKPFPSINNAVDLANLLAIRFLLPIGLYDASRIEGPVTLREGRAGESYPGIRRDEIHLEGRPVAADAVGPFGNPTADSLRTCVEESARALWMVVFAPASFDRSLLGGHIEAARSSFARHLAEADRPMSTRVELLQ